MKKLLISTDNAAGARKLKFFANEPDDSLALAVLLGAHKNKEIEVIGITSSFGNTDGETSYRITKKQVELSRLNIPVIKGASYPNQSYSHAVEFGSHKLGENKGRVVLVGLGPATDFAALFKKFPHLKEKVGYFFLVRSGPYFLKRYWYLCSFNAIKDIKAANFMYRLGANRFQMGKEIFRIGLDNTFVKKLQEINHPMMKFITKDLILWNRQNKIFPNRGYFLRKGNMCPWDLIWAMYLIEPYLFEVERRESLTILHPKEPTLFLEKVWKKLKKWED